MNKKEEQKQTKQEIVIKRIHGTDTRTTVDLPRIPQFHDILVLHEEHSDLVQESDSKTIELKVLSIRTRFDLRNPDNPQTEIVTEMQ